MKQTENETEIQQNVQKPKVSNKLTEDKQGARGNKATKRAQKHTEELR